MLGLVPSIHAFIATNLWSLRRLIHHGVSTACGDPQAPQNFGTELGRGEHWAFVFFSVYLRPAGAPPSKENGSSRSRSSRASTPFSEAMAAPSKGVDPRDKPEGDGVRCLPLSSIFMGEHGERSFSKGATRPSVIFVVTLPKPSSKAGNRRRRPARRAPGRGAGRPHGRSD
jgi:hypothetical protein